MSTTNILKILGAIVVAVALVLFFWFWRKHEKKTDEAVEAHKTALNTRADEALSIVEKDPSPTNLGVLQEAEDELKAFTKASDIKKESLAQRRLAPLGELQERVLERQKKSKKKGGKKGRWYGPSIDKVEKGAKLAEAVVRAKTAIDALLAQASPISIDKAAPPNISPSDPLSPTQMRKAGVPRKDALNAYLASKKGKPK